MTAPAQGLGPCSPRPGGPLSRASTSLPLTSFFYHSHRVCLSPVIRYETCHFSITLLPDEPWPVRTKPLDTKQPALSLLILRAQLSTDSYRRMKPSMYIVFKSNALSCQEPITQSLPPFSALHPCPSPDAHCRKEAHNRLELA